MVSIKFAAKQVGIGIVATILIISLGHALSYLLG